MARPLLIPVTTVLVVAVMLSGKVSFLGGARHDEQRPTYPRPVTIYLVPPKPVNVRGRNGCPLLAGTPTCARNPK